MLINLIKKILFVFSVSFLSISVYKKVNKHIYEKENLVQQYEDIERVKRKFDDLKQRYIMEMTYFTITSFMQGFSMEEIEKFINNQNIDPNDYGLIINSDCKFNIIFNEKEEKIICNLSHNFRYSGDLIFTRLNNNVWSCEYTGDFVKKPDICVN